MEKTATVASFRTWRVLQPSIAQDPAINAVRNVPGGYESLGKAIIHQTDTKSNQQKVFRRGLKNNGGEGGI